MLPIDTNNSDLVRSRRSARRELGPDRSPAPDAHRGQSGPLYTRHRARFQNNLLQEEEEEKGEEEQENK